MPRQQRQSTGSRKCYCDLHVTRGERIPHSRWVQHQDRLWAENDLQQEEAQTGGRLISDFIAGHAELINNYDNLDADELQEDEEQRVDSPERYRNSILEDDTLDGNESQSTSPLNNNTDDSDNEETTASENGFTDEDLDYDSSFHQFSSFEALNNVSDWRIEDERLHYAIRLAIWKIEHGVSDTAFGNRPLSRSEIEDGSMSFYRVKKRLKSLTGLVPEQVPCCANNCSAFIDKSEQECPYCGDRIYEEIDLASGTVIRPRKTFFYFSPIERLLLEYATPNAAREMIEYMSYIRGGSGGSDIISDFWNGSHFAAVKNRFSDHRTLALTLSTDGVQNVRQKSSSVWPILLTNLNYPPELRARNMMIVGLIPGPKEPAIFSSFFDHLLRDLQKLSNGVGIRAYDSHSQEYFRLQAHLTVVTGDMPAIAKMMSMKGSNGVSPCRFCSITGQYSRSCRHWYYPRNSEDIQYRQDLRREALMVSAANDDALRKLQGINGLSFLKDITTLHFPNSFGLDIMHLFSNVAKSMWNVWTGNLLPEPDFDNPADSYLISSNQQADIGQEMCQAGRHVPVFVSRTPRDISKHKASFKAVDWFQWITIYSCPLLYKRLPQYALTSWQFFVDAVRLALSTKLSLSEVTQMEVLFQSFVDTTESIYYQSIEENLAICTSQLHALLHVATTIRALGPTFVSWQFGLERYAGKMEPLTTSKSQLNVSLYNGLEMLEQLRYVKLLYNIGSSRPISMPYRSLEIVNESGQKIGSFTGSRVERLLGTVLRTLLCQHYGCNYDAVCPAYKDWTKLVREIASGTANSFTITASNSDPQPRLARDRSCCMFLWEDVYGVSAFSFGRVTRFIEHEHNNLSRHLALIKVFNVIEESEAKTPYYIDELQSAVLVEVSAIVEIIGRIPRAHKVEGTRLRRPRTAAETRYWIARSSRLEMAMQ